MLKKLVKRIRELENEVLPSYEEQHNKTFLMYGEKPAMDLKVEVSEVKGQIYGLKSAYEMITGESYRREN